MAFVSLAESGHPELEEAHVVLFTGTGGPQQGENLLRVLPTSPIHLRELK